MMLNELLVAFFGFGTMEKIMIPRKRVGISIILGNNSPALAPTSVMKTFSFGKNINMATKPLSIGTVCCSL